MPVTWDEARWRAAYRATIADPLYGADFRPCTIVDGVVQATAHPFSGGEYVLFRGVQATTSAGDPAERATYRVATTPAPTADAFNVAANAPGLPLMDFPDQACEYSGTRHQEVVTYGRDYYTVAGNPFPRRWTNLVRALGIVPDDRVLVIGSPPPCLLVEVARDAGFPSVWPMDPNTPPGGGGGVRQDITVIPHDVRDGGQMRARLRQDTGGDTFDWVITEDVLTSYDPATEPDVVAEVIDDSEARLAAGLDEARCVHMVSIPVRPPFTSLPLDQWKAVRPAHTWIRLNLGGWEVL